MRVNKTSIIDFKAYQKFRESNKKICTRKNITDYVDHGKILSLFYRKIGYYVSEAREGVWIDGLGYFGVINTNMKRQGYEYFEDEYNWETKGYCFSLLFMPAQRESKVFKTFTLDYTFSPVVKKRLVSNLKKGERYNYNAFIFIK